MRMSRVFWIVLWQAILGLTFSCSNDNSSFHESRSGSSRFLVGEDGKRGVLDVNVDESPENSMQTSDAQASPSSDDSSSSDGAGDSASESGDQSSDAVASNSDSSSEDPSSDSSSSESSDSSSDDASSDSMADNSDSGADSSADDANSDSTSDQASSDDASSSDSMAENSDNEANSPSEEGASEDGASEQSDNDSSEMASDEDANSDDSDSDMVAGKCAKNFGLSKDRVKVAGRDNNEVIEPTDVIAVKVTGRNNHVTINLNGSADLPEIGGLCVFMAGREAHVEVNLTSVKLGKLMAIRRGNRSQLDVNVDENSSIGEFIDDLKGQAAKASGESAANEGESSSADATAALDLEPRDPGDELITECPTAYMGPDGELPLKPKKCKPNPIDI